MEHMKNAIKEMYFSPPLGLASFQGVLTFVKKPNLLSGIPWKSENNIRIMKHHKIFEYGGNSHSNLHFLYSYIQY